MDIMIILELIERSLTIIALISGIVVAWLGLNTWRQQIAGTAEHDLARRVLKAVYEFKEKVYWTRTWGTFKDASNNSQVISDSMTELSTILPEIEALWGKEIKDSVNKIMLMGYRLLAALELEKRGKEKNEILIASTDESDSFSQDLDNMIEKLRKSIQPKLLFRKNNWKRKGNKP